MAKLQEQSVGDKGVLTKNYNSLVRLANQVGRANLGPGLVGMVGAAGVSPVFKIDKSNNPVPDAQGITSTATLSGTVKRRTIDIELPDISATSPLRPNWDEWGLFDVVKLQTTGFRRYPYYDTLGSTTLGATTDTNESVGVLRWDFPPVMLGSSTSKALAYARNSGTYPGLDSSATFLGTSTFIQETLHVEGVSDPTVGGTRAFDSPGEDGGVTFVAVATAGAPAVSVLSRASLASTALGSIFAMSNIGGDSTVRLATTSHAVFAQVGPIEVVRSTDEYRHVGQLGLTGGLGTSSLFSGGILIDRGDTDFPLSHGIDRLEWKLNGIIGNGTAQDGLVPVQTSGCIQCVIITADERGNTGNNTFDINLHQPSASIATQQNATAGTTIFFTKPVITGNTPTKADNAIRGFEVTTCDFDAGDFFTMDVDANTNARDVTVTMFVKYKSVNCDFGV